MSDDKDIVLDVPPVVVTQRGVLKRRDTPEQRRGLIRDGELLNVVNGHVRPWPPSDGEKGTPR